jgi:hypothetical protein
VEGLEGIYVANQQQNVIGLGEGDSTVSLISFDKGKQRKELNPHRVSFLFSSFLLSVSKVANGRKLLLRLTTKEMLFFATHRIVLFIFTALTNLIPPFTLMISDPFTLPTMPLDSS